MDVYQTGKKKFIACIFIAITVAVFLIDTGCNAKSDQVKSGNEITYTGQVQTKDKTITSVKLAVKYPLNPGQQAVVLSYGGKRMCTCQGAYEGESDGKKIFSLISQNGGTFCDKLEILEISVQSEGGNSVSYLVRSSGRTTMEEGKLSKTSK